MGNVDNLPCRAIFTLIKRGEKFQLFLYVFSFVCPYSPFTLWMSLQEKLRKKALSLSIREMRIFVMNAIAPHPRSESHGGKSRIVSIANLLRASNKMAQP